MRELLADSPAYRWSDSLTRVQVLHKPTRTRLIVRGANSKAIFGLVNCPWVIADEPGAWKVLDGEAMYDSIQTAQGKPGSPLKALYLGTLAPALSGWWHELVAARIGRQYLRQAPTGNTRDLGSLAHNPQGKPTNGPSRRHSERSCSRSVAKRGGDSRLKSRFLSYRLNLPDRRRVSDSLDRRRLAGRYLTTRGSTGRAAYRSDRPGRRASMERGCRYLAGGARGRYRARAGDPRPGCPGEEGHGAVRSLSAALRGWDPTDGWGVTGSAARHAVGVHNRTLGNPGINRL